MSQAPYPAHRKGALHKTVVCGAALMLLSAFDTAQAFCPNNGYKCGFSGVGKTHQDITTYAITAIDSEIFRTDRLTTSMKIALKEISQANSDVDGNQENGFLHFDGESLEFGKNVLQRRLTAVIKALDDRADSVFKCNTQPCKVLRWENSTDI